MTSFSWYFKKFSSLEYDNVFKPFYKINKGRVLQVIIYLSLALGLDYQLHLMLFKTILTHGGKISLDKSNLGGLKVKISLPLFEDFLILFISFSN